MSETKTTGEGHIYVVEIAPGRCKVGRSVHRFNRLAAYAHRDTELMAWSSPRFAGHCGAETQLIHRLALRHPRIPGTTEEFAVDFAKAVGAARALVAEIEMRAAA